jgi:hypothetical protein
MNKLFFAFFLSLYLTIGTHAQTVEGDWQGTLNTGAVELRLVFHVMKDEKEALKATLDSIDQNALGIPVTSISVSDSILRFEIQTINGSYEGKINADRTTISGTWSQGGASFPLEFTQRRKFSNRAILMETGRVLCRLVPRNFASSFTFSPTKMG